MSTPEDLAAAIRDHQNLIAWINAGFTREEAMMILARPYINVVTAATLPPEMSELYSKMSRIIDRNLLEDTE